jgi:hypothetical protein
LQVRKVIGRAREVRGTAVYGKDVILHIIPVPILARSSASRWVIAPNCACPSLRGGATLGTVMSWIIHPSYQPLSLSITNYGEMSVKTSLNAQRIVRPARFANWRSNASNVRCLWRWN